jgi:hypothetical protein
VSTTLIAFYKKHRLTLAYLIMSLVLVAPYLDIVFPALDLRVKILSALPLFLLFLFNDWRTEMDDRLKKVENGLNNPDPPMFRRFPAMEEEMNQVLNALVASSDKVTVKVIGVSSKFSRPFLLRVIDDLIEAEQKKVLDIEIGIVVTEPAKLGEWGLDDWERSSRISIEEICTFQRKHLNKMIESKIDLELFEYDNIPHWHGVMFNDKILFMGRTEWYKGGDDLQWQLRVGEVEYRRFERGDSYGGAGRIDRFMLWYQRYRERALSNGKSHSMKTAHDITSAARLALSQGKSQEAKTVSDA